MSTRIRNTPQYFKEFRKLARKYPSVIQDVDNLVGVIKNDERPGDLIPNVGYEVYKVRLANPSAQKGKSGGFRLIYYVELADSIILLSIYSKSDYEDMPLHRIQTLIQEALSDDESASGDENA